ncbi:hypothetical protein [Microcystis phage MaeS]|nr:hypothetical protein [Microcystis phage MaeS]
MARKFRKRKDYLKGYKVVIKQHVVDRYMERAGVDEEEARTTLEKKFRDSKLTQLLPDGSERRMEVGGSLNRRLIFVAQKYGRKFVVITCYLQGARDSWWKNEGLIIEKDEQPDITAELETLFGEEVQNG